MQIAANNNSNYQASPSAYWPLQLNRASKAPQQTLKARLQNLTKTLICQLTASSEPCVWPTQDASGQTVWNAKDAASERAILNASETELRIWLEERYTF